MRTAKPFLVEVTGVAGAGKSTVARLLVEADPRFRRAEFIQTRTPRHLWYLLRSVPRLLPILTANVWLTPRLSWADVKLLAYVTEWHTVLARRPACRDAVTVLDQGPVYALARLRARRRGVARSRSFHRWWNDEADRWARDLDVVVRLDARDRVVRSRVDGRAQPHSTKGAPPGVADRFLKTYRELFDEVCGRLEAAEDGPRVHTVDTTSDSAERVAERVRSLLEDATAAIAQPSWGRS